MTTRATAALRTARLLSTEIPPLAYPINTNNVVEVQIVGLLHGQTTRNVWHYYLEGSGALADGAAAIQTLLEDFVATVYAAFLNCVSNEWTAQAVTGQLIWPDRYRVVVISAGDLPSAIGAVANASCPSGVSGIVKLQCELAGKAFRGRKYVPAVPVNYEDASTLNALGQTPYGVLAALMPLPLAVGVRVFQPTLSRGEGAPLQRVVDSNVEIRLRYQRRRAVGLGE